MTDAALASKLQFTARCKRFATINELANSNNIFIESIPFRLFKGGQKRVVSDLFTCCLMLKDHTLNGIQEVIFPLCRPHLTNLKCHVTDPFDFSQLLLHMSTYFREVFVISQGIPKLRNISTNFSEVFVISQGIPNLLTSELTL